MDADRGRCAGLIFMPRALRCAVRKSLGFLVAVDTSAGWVGVAVRPGGSTADGPYVLRMPTGGLVVCSSRSSSGFSCSQS